MNLCLFGGARDTVPEVYIKQTEALGYALAQRGHALVFGGGASGMMGAAARGVQRGHGRLVGIAPDYFSTPGVLVPGCDEMIFTQELHDRKQQMEARSDGFIIAPGGLGTLDEFFQVFTLKTLNRHQKPVAVFNVNGYYDGLFAFLKDAQGQDFLTAENLACAPCFADPQALLDYMEREG
jgi:hypothetical protein